MPEHSIILVDDDHGARETLTDILTDWGYSPKAFEKGLDAVHAFEKDPTDILLVDIKLPDISGIKVLEQAREINPDVAVLIMTGHTSLENAVQAMNQGATAYITKPINMEELKVLLKKASREVHLSQENKRLIDKLQLTNRNLGVSKGQLERTNAHLASITQEMEDILHIVSHDLKSPLINIQGFAASLNEEASSLLSDVRDFVPLELQEWLSQCQQKISKSFQFIQKGTSKMDSMIQNLLCLSRVGRQADQFEKNDLNVLLADIHDIFSHQLVQLKIEFVCRPLPKVFCRKNEIHQVFSNLITNAITYMGYKPLKKIEIDCCLIKDFYRFSVSDTGIGIEEKNLEDIFKVFSRVGELNVQGEGIGLAIVKKIIRGHSGGVWVESKKGEGSTFFFTLPKGEGIKSSV